MKCAENGDDYGRRNEVTLRERMPFLHYSTYIPD
jgi:hypothetical protein